MIRDLAHVGISVFDFDRMVAFYRESIGLEVTSFVPHPSGGRKAVFAGSDAESIEMIAYLAPKPIPERDRFRTGIHHFGFLVDDIETETVRLAGLGVEMDGPIGVNTRGDRVQHFWDPEGNRVHLTQRR